MVLAASTVTAAAKKVKLTPSELDLTTQGGSKELECECDGLCKGVRWHKDGKELRWAEKMQIIGDKLIFFSNDDQNLVGEYRCEVDGTFSDAANVRFSCKYDLKLFFFFKLISLTRPFLTTNDDRLRWNNPIYKKGQVRIGRE